MLTNGLSSGLKGCSPFIFFNEGCVFVFFSLFSMELREIYVANFAKLRTRVDHMIGIPWPLQIFFDLIRQNDEC